MSVLASSVTTREGLAETQMIPSPSAHVLAPGHLQPQLGPSWSTAAGAATEDALTTTALWASGRAHAHAQTVYRSHPQEFGPS